MGPPFPTRKAGGPDRFPQYLAVGTASSPYQITAADLHARSVSTRAKTYFSTINHHGAVNALILPGILGLLIGCSEFAPSLAKHCRETVRRCAVDGPSIAGAGLAFSWDSPTSRPRWRPRQR
jgi:hypothetical protein